MSKYQPKVELMDIDLIKPYDKNAKIHTETQVKSLANVIASQGWDVPIVVDKDGVIIKGHGRRLAALHLGLKEVPVIVRRDMTDAEVKAARLSDNRVAMGDFDVDAIRDELAALKNDGFNLDSMGFDEKEVQMMLGDLDALNFDAFDVQPGTTAVADTTNDASATVEDQPKPDTDRPVKAVSITEVLGFKHIPGEYQNDVVEFVSMAESASDKQGAEAFCELIRNLLKGMTADEAHSN